MHLTLQQLSTSPKTDSVCQDISNLQPTASSFTLLQLPEIWLSHHEFSYLNWPLREILGYKIITLEGKKAEQKETQTSTSGQGSNK